jgi:sphingomyelin phosphodiesterase
LEISNYWSRDLDSKAIEDLKSGGHYTIEAMPGLRVVALNTQYGDTWNFYLLLNDNQVPNETAWLVDILTAARAAGEKVRYVSTRLISVKVILTGHIPTNCALTFNTWAVEYVDIVNEFKDIIVGQFFGYGSISPMVSDR